MPPKKRTKEEADDEVEEEEVEAETSEKAEAGQSFKNKDGTKGWELGNKKRLTVTSFKSRVFVDIREFYEKDGKLLPGKKGIFLTPEQFALVCSLKDEVEKELDKD